MKIYYFYFFLFFFFINDTAPTEIYTRPYTLPYTTLFRSRCGAGRTGISLRATPDRCAARVPVLRSEEHTSELQSHGLISYAVFFLKKNTHRSGRASQDQEHASRHPPPQHTPY